MDQLVLDNFIIRALEEDIGDGDHTSLACVPGDADFKAELLAKQSGIIAGLEIAKRVFLIADKNLTPELFISDGSEINPGDRILQVSGPGRSILKTERLVLNIMQRMSGIATQTRLYVNKVSGTGARILDTRKTTPNIRFLEKEAVRIGGGCNHRMGLYDMIMIKDNHIDYAGGIEEAINKAVKYLRTTGKNLRIEIEARNFEELGLILKTGGVDIIMLDNFSLEETKKAVTMIDRKYEVESSGGINLGTVRDYAETGVNFISVGALTHQILSLDMSLKAV